MSHVAELPEHAPYPGPGAAPHIIPLAADVYDQSLYWLTHRHVHLLVAGPSGTGKTGLHRTILSHVLAHPDSWDVYVIDPKAQHTDLLAGHPNVRAHTTTADQTHRMLLDLVREIVRRATAAEKAGVARYTHIDHDVDPPHLMLLVDDLHLLTEPSTPLGDQIDGLVQEVEILAPKADAHVGLTSPGYGKAILRPNFVNRYQMRISTQPDDGQPTIPGRARVPDRDIPVSVQIYEAP